MTEFPVMSCVASAIPPRLSKGADDVCDDKNRASSPEHPTWIINTHRGCQPAPRNHAQPCAYMSWIATISGNVSSAIHSVAYP